MSSFPPPNALERSTAEPPGPAEPDPPPEDERVPWPVWTVPAGVVLGLVIGVLAGVIVSAVAQAGGARPGHLGPAANIAADIVFDLGFVLAAIYLASRGRRRIRALDFGFRRIGIAHGIGAFFVAGIGYYVVTALYASLIGLHGSDKLPSELGVSKSTAALVAAAVFVCAIAPVCEEFFCRGFVFGGLRRMRIVVAGRELGTWVAAVLTGILFGLAHTGSASSQYLIPLGFLGFVLCLVRWRTGSLYPCMALHSVNNALALGVNQLHWNGLEILGLMAGSLAVIAAVTAPLSRRADREPTTALV
jgi:membrane protease YdiL (CAAX protease family)